MHHVRTKTLVVLASFVFLVDILSKRSVYFLEHTGHASFPVAVFTNFLGIDFSITFAENTGAAWGLFDTWPNLLVFFRICLLVGIFIYFFWYNKHPVWRVPLVLIMTGAFANIVDYFIYGYVVDMFLFCFWGYEYPVFNVADSAIFIGAFWIAFSALTEGRHKEKQS